MIDVMYDMETADVDDVCALCLLCYHPSVSLRGVTVTPGSRKQVWAVRQILKMCGHAHVGIGSYNRDHPRDCVSGPIIKFFGGSVGEDEPDADGWYGMERVLHDFPDTVLVTGAPLCNAKAWLERTAQRIKLWVGQGGFAGDNVVPPEDRLKKFEGLTTCPTFNFNGNPKGALMMLASDRVGRRLLVSKNVCHGVVYDKRMHDCLKATSNPSPAFQTMMAFMDGYLATYGIKAFHDPLAVCCAIDPSICRFEPVEVYRERGEWGSRPSSLSNTSISVKVDMERFVKTLCCR